MSDFFKENLEIVEIPNFAPRNHLIFHCFALLKAQSVKECMSSWILPLLSTRVGYLEKAVERGIISDDGQHLCSFREVKSTSGSNVREVREEGGDLKIVNVSIIFFVFCKTGKNILKHVAFNSIK